MCLTKDSHFLRVLSEGGFCFAVGALAVVVNVFHCRRCMRVSIVADRNLDVRGSSCCAAPMVVCWCRAAGPPFVEICRPLGRFDL